MSIARAGGIGQANSKSAGTTLVLTTIADVNEGEIILLGIAFDNTATADNVDSREIIGIEDSVGNWYCRAGETINGQGAAGAGIGCAGWFAKARRKLISGSTIAVTFGASITSKAVSGERWTVGAGKTIALTGRRSSSLQDAATDPASMAITLDTSREYGFWRLVAFEGDSTDSWAGTSSYTEFTVSKTTGGAEDSNVSIRGETRVLTGTTDTSDPGAMGATARDLASVFYAFWEVDDVGIDLIDVAMSNLAPDSTPTLTLPINKAGDWMVAFMAWQGTRYLTGLSSWIPMGGVASQAGGGGGTPTGMLLAKKSTGAEGADVTFTADGASTSHSAICSWRGCHPTWPVDDVCKEGNDVSNTQTVATAPALDVTVPRSLLIHFASSIDDDTNVTWTPPSGFNEEVDATGGASNTPVIVSSKPFVGLGSTGTMSATRSAGSKVYAAALALVPNGEIPETKFRGVKTRTSGGATSLTWNGGGDGYIATASWSSTSENLIPPNAAIISACSAEIGSATVLTEPAGLGQMARSSDDTVGFSVETAYGLNDGDANDITWSCASANIDAMFMAWFSACPDASDKVNAAEQENASSTSVTAPSVVAFPGGVEVFVASADDGNAVTMTPPTNFTEAVDIQAASTDVPLYMAYRLNTPGGASGSIVGTVSTAQENAGQHLAFRSGRGANFFPPFDERPTLNQVRRM